MSPLLLRCMFAGLFLVAVASRIQSSSAAPPDGLAVVAGILEQQGLSPARDRTAVQFSAPGCDRPIRVQALSMSLEEVALYRAMAGPGHVERYIYLGEIRPKAEPVALRASWIKHQVLSSLGLARHRLLRMVLFATEPADCDAIERIDWRPVWDVAAPARS
jgi:hypothetical protein